MNTHYSPPCIRPFISLKFFKFTIFLITICLSVLATYTHVSAQSVAETSVLPAAAADPIWEPGSECLIRDGTLFASTPAGSLALINYSSGYFELAGEPSGGLRFSPAYVNEVLYIADISGTAGSYLKTYNPLTGETTEIGEIRDTGGVPVLINEIVYNPVRRTIYGVQINQKQLVKIEKTNGYAYPLGDPFTKSIHALAARKDGVMFAALENNGSSSEFVQMTVNNAGMIATVTTIGTIDLAPVAGMTFLGNGELIAAHRISETETNLYNIDPETGEKTFISSVPGLAVSKLTALSSPTYWTTPNLIEIGGREPALAVDHADNVHIAYPYASSKDYHDDQTVFIYWDSKSCGMIEPIYSTIDSTEYTGSNSSLTVDSNNNLHASYYAQGLGYATRDAVTGSWDLTPLTTFSGGVMTAITTDTGDKVHISHYGEGTLEYTTNESGEWQTTTIDYKAGYSDWGGTAIVTDSDNSVHIVYYDDYNDPEDVTLQRQNLKYATNISGSWAISIIEESEDKYKFNKKGLTPSLAIDSDNKLHVSYMVQEYTEDPFTIITLLRYATNRENMPGTVQCPGSSNWNCKIFEKDDEFYDEFSGGAFSVIAVDGTGTVRISHLDSSTLKHAKMFASGSWSFADVLSIPWNLQLYDISMAIDSSETSHIAYTIMDHFAGIDEARVYYVSEIDNDSDGLSNLVETNTRIYNSANDTGTDPNNADTDNDGLNDGLEVYSLFTNPVKVDSDEDGILDIDEDSDGDGFTNAEEIQCESDPGNPSSKCFKGLPFLMLLLD